MTARSAAGWLEAAILWIGAPLAVRLGPLPKANQILSWESASSYVGYALGNPGVADGLWLRLVENGGPRRPVSPLPPSGQSRLGFGPPSCPLLEVHGRCSEQRLNVG